MYNVIAADIGGTNSRFGLFTVTTPNEFNLVDDIWLQTNEFNSLDSIIEHLIKINFIRPSDTAQQFSIAVPGPVLGEKTINMINVKWQIKIDRLKKNFPNYKFSFLNDFIAQAFAFLTEEGRKNLKPIKGGLDIKFGDIVVVGAGTGLGHSCLKKVGNNYIPLPSEAGHTTFPFVNDEEEKFRNFINKEIGTKFPTLNDIVSGGGLKLLHRYLTGQDISPELIVKDTSSFPEITKWFSKFYARCCKNYCLSVLSQCGQLFLTGGIASDNPFLVDNDIFREEFITSSLTSNLLQETPIYLSTNKNIGLWGAAYYSIQSDKKCITIQ